VVLGPLAAEDRAQLAREFCWTKARSPQVFTTAVLASQVTTIMVHFLLVSRVPSAWSPILLGHQRAWLAILAPVSPIC
jgi:hypothetical protein